MLFLTVWPLMWIDMRKFWVQIGSFYTVYRYIDWGNPVCLCLNLCLQIHGIDFVRRLCELRYNRRLCFFDTTEGLPSGAHYRLTPQKDCLLVLLITN